MRDLKSLSNNSRHKKYFFFFTIKFFRLQYSMNGNSLTLAQSTVHGILTLEEVLDDCTYFC